MNDYQHYALDAVKSCSQYEEMGAQVTVYRKGSQELEEGGVREEEELRGTIMFSAIIFLY